VAIGRDLKFAIALAAYDKHGGVMHDKTALVTGSTAGIGKETARGLARLGARVILVGYNRSSLRLRPHQM
jgi:hypothetical protein